MGKKSRLKKEKREKLAQNKFPMWEDENGIHTSFIAPAVDSPGYQNELTSEFQKNIKQSPMWKDMLKKFGKDKAEELLKQCKAEIK